MDDRFEASIADAYDRGVEAGRADAVPPGVEPMPWCEPHNTPMLPDRNVCYWGRAITAVNPANCRREVKVAHWVTE